jgi:hypothetical protein
VSDAGGQLSDRFQPLDLAQRGVHSLAFFDLLHQLPVGARQLGCARLHPLL